MAANNKTQSTPPALRMGEIGNREDYGTALLERCGGIMRQKPDYKTDTGKEQYQAMVEGFMDDVKKWGDDYYAQAYLIMHDPRLTIPGQLEKLTPIQNQFNGRFNDDIVKRCRNLQDLHFAKVKKIFELPSEITGGDPIIVFLQSQEIRGYLRTLPMMERIQAALGSDDPALLHALDTCPDCLQLLPEGMIQRAHDFRVKRRRGRELAEAEDERLALDRVTGVIKNVPSAVPFVNISPLLPNLPETVYVEMKPDEFMSFAAGSEEIARISAEMAEMFLSSPTGKQ